MKEKSLQDQKSNKPIYYGLDWKFQAYKYTLIHIKHIFKEGGLTMYCTFNGKICLMMWDIVAGKWCYISEETWYRMPEKARSRYTEERTN